MLLKESTHIPEGKVGQTEVNLLKNAEMNTEVFFQMKVEKIIAKE